MLYYCLNQNILNRNLQFFEKKKPCKEVLQIMIIQRIHKVNALMFRREKTFYALAIEETIFQIIKHKA